MSRAAALTALLVSLLAAGSAPARADAAAIAPRAMDGDAGGTKDAPDETAGTESPAENAADEAPRATRELGAGSPRPAKLEALVPALAENAYRLGEGPRPYLHRLAFSPGFGRLGAERLFVFRLAFHPASWLGWEAALNHNPARSVHAAHHSLSALVRRPLPGRFQPFLAAGYGMFMVFPGRSLNADPVTKNALSGGGGLEFFVRDDLAIRGDVRRTTVFGRDRDREGVVAYDYLEQSIALVFYRTLTP